MPRPFRSSRGKSPYRGSVLLASGAERVVRALAASAFLWALTGWAMGWW